MTRINAGIKPAELVDKHLLAEHREIIRIPNCISKGRFNLEGQPSKFTLGKGHVKFFYTRLLYLKNRYIEIYNECKKRDFKVQNYISSWDNIPKEFMNDYKPTREDIEIITQRIKEKLNKND